MAPAQSKPIAKKDGSKSPTRRASRSSASAANNLATARLNSSAAAVSTNASTPSSTSNTENDALLEFLRANSAPLENGIRLAGSPRSPSSGPRQAIIIVHIIYKPVGIHGYIYGFRRFEEPDKGTYVEKIHRDQIRSRDPTLLGPPLNIIKTTYGAYENGEPILNDKGYELSAFVAIQNFQGKTVQAVREHAKVFATAVKNHIERDPGCQNQEIVVSEHNIHYDENNVFMDFLGEKNAVNLYRTILPVDSTPGYSQFYASNARSFFREGTLSPQSVAFIKGDDTFLRNEQEEHNEHEEQNGNEENGDQEDQNANETGAARA